MLETHHKGGNTQHNGSEERERARGIHRNTRSKNSERERKRREMARLRGLRYIRRNVSTAEQKRACTVDYIIMHNVKLVPSCSLQFPYDDGANFTLCIMM